ncbi:hypothetical protein [Halobellus sp. EA9]|uniref:hypothetical protein n=1 Tax=Halobellus sp. EA9 TaxID=3421647 RepID=UPI003EBCDB84
MPSTFVRAGPLQALKLAAVVCVVAFGLLSFVDVLPGQELNGLLFLAFFPVVLAVVVGTEALLAVYRLLRAEDPIARLTDRRAYTAVRAIEAVVAVVAPGTFYVLVVRIGGDVAGLGAVGLLFVGVGLAGSAYGSVILRTLAEYYYHRKRSPPSRADERAGGLAE